MKTNFAGWIKATVSTFLPSPPSSPSSSTSSSSSVSSGSSGLLILCPLALADPSSRSKLHFENNFNRNHTDMMMKSAKAVIILVPIFGIHFLLLPIRPAKDSSLVYPYEVNFHPQDGAHVPSITDLIKICMLLLKILESNLQPDCLLPLHFPAGLLHLHPPLLCKPRRILSDKVCIFVPCLANMFYVM